MKEWKGCESAKGSIQPRMPNFQQLIDPQIEGDPIGQTLGIGDFWERLFAANEWWFNSILWVDYGWKKTRRTANKCDKESTQEKLIKENKTARYKR